jgi:hypothetical protein
MGPLALTFASTIWPLRSLKRDASHMMSLSVVTGTNLEPFCTVKRRSAEARTHAPRDANNHSAYESGLSGSRPHPTFVTKCSAHSLSDHETRCFWRRPIKTHRVFSNIHISGVLRCCLRMLPEGGRWLLVLVASHHSTAYPPICPHPTDLAGHMSGQMPDQFTDRALLLDRIKTSKRHPSSEV